MYALINPCNLICNMQLNVLNDLAEAMKALGRKKRAVLPSCILFMIATALFSHTFRSHSSTAFELALLLCRGRIVGAECLEEGAVSHLWRQGSNS